MQRIDLTRLRTTANIHKLLGMLGMRQTCSDLNMACAEWARAGQCNANPDYMSQQCRKSCGLCAKDELLTDRGPPCVNTAPEHDCEYWSTMGECTSNESFMRTGCTKACGFCTVQGSRPTPGEDADLADNDDIFKDEM